MITESVDLALRQLLLDDGVIGTLVVTKIYPQAAPGRAKLPYMVITPIMVEPDHSLSGNVGLWRASIQVDGYSDSYDEVRALARATYRALHGRPNPTYVTVEDPSGVNPPEAFTLQYLRLQSDASDLFQPTDGSDVPIHRFSHDYRVAYNVSDISH